MLIGGLLNLNIKMMTRDIGKKIKGCRGEYNIPDHNVWINN